MVLHSGKSELKFKKKKKNWAVVTREGFPRANVFKIFSMNFILRANGGINYITKIPRGSIVNCILMNYKIRK